MRNYYYTHLVSFFKFFLRIFIKNYARRFFSFPCGALKQLRESAGIFRFFVNLTFL